ncbi:lissencephaly-1 [Anaeramoeba flamelloides]|uniref:Lissencephaly-1 n=1 Tax=Anaeramoeba flamelloides TaxID=1746091 RepID=A0AAV7ZM47_9EUKA|nr:lissencephaly-1 [Anaeramoeba flamelloides]
MTSNQKNQIFPKEISIEKIIRSRDYKIENEHLITSVYIDKENLYLGIQNGDFIKTPLYDLKLKNSTIYNFHNYWIFQIRKRKRKRKRKTKTKTKTKTKEKGLIVTSSRDGKIILTDPKTQKKVKEFDGSYEVYQTIDYDDRIYSFSSSKRIVCWDFETTKLVKAIQTKYRSHNCAAFESESGKIFSGTNEGNVVVLDPERNKVVRSFRAYKDSSVGDITSKDGIVYTACNISNFGTIKGWDAHTYRKVKTFEGHKRGSFRLKTKWNYLFSLGNDQKIKIWDLETTRCLYFISFENRCKDFDFHKKFIYAGNGDHLAMINLETELEITEFLSQSSYNFLNLFKNPKFCDFKIFDYPVHKFLIKLRCGTETEEVKITLENNFTKEKAFKFLEWVYGSYGQKKSKLNISEIQKIAYKFGITREELVKKTLQSDLTKAFYDQNSKDFSLIVKDHDKNNEYEEQEENKEEENKEEEKQEEESKEESKEEDKEDYKEEENKEEEKQEEEEKEKEEDDDDDDENKEEKEQFKEIKVHKFILQARCGLFRGFFEYLQEQEKITKKNQVKDYSGISIESMKHFVKYLYFNEIQLTEDDDMQLIYDELSGAVDYYQLDKHCNLPNCLEKIKKEYNLN